MWLTGEFNIFIHGPILTNTMLFKTNLGTGNPLLASFFTFELSLGIILWVYRYFHVNIFTNSQVTSKLPVCLTPNLIQSSVSWWLQVLFRVLFKINCYVTLNFLGKFPKQRFSKWPPAVPSEHGIFILVAILTDKK